VVRERVSPRRRRQHHDGSVANSSFSGVVNPKLGSQSAKQRCQTVGPILFVFPMQNKQEPFRQKQIHDIRKAMKAFFSATFIWIY